MSYEYKVVPAPVRGLKAKGVKTAQDRFAHALETKMNELAADGWEYIRTDTLPSEQREGLMGKTTVYQNMLVFRRAPKKENEPFLSLIPEKSEQDRKAEREALRKSAPKISKPIVKDPPPVVADTPDARPYPVEAAEDVPTEDLAEDTQDTPKPSDKAAE